jgi:hypothetical protein
MIIAIVILSTIFVFLSGLVIGGMIVINDYEPKLRSIRQSSDRLIRDMETFFESLEINKQKQDEKGLVKKVKKSK